MRETQRVDESQLSHVRQLGQEQSTMANISHSGQDESETADESADEKLARKEAKERQQEHGNEQPRSGDSPDRAYDAGRTRDMAAEAVGMSGSSNRSAGMLDVARSYARSGKLPDRG